MSVVEILGLNLNFRNFQFGRSVQLLLSQSPYRDISIPWSPFYASDWDAADMFPTFLQMFVTKPNLLATISSPHQVFLVENSWNVWISVSDHKAIVDRRARKLGGSYDLTSITLGNLPYPLLVGLWSVDLRDGGQEAKVLAGYVQTNVWGVFPVQKSQKWLSTVLIHTDFCSSTTYEHVL